MAINTTTGDNLPCLQTFHGMTVATIHPHFRMDIRAHFQVMLFVILFTTLIADTIFTRGTARKIPADKIAVMTLQTGLGIWTTNSVTFAMTIQAACHMAAHAVGIKKLWISLRPTSLTKLLLGRTGTHGMLKDTLGLLMAASTANRIIIDGCGIGNISSHTMTLATA